jgi:Sulfotransferase family
VAPLDTSRPTPVFVLGQHRSGTTWLANILANHPRVVAVQSDDHFGVHESIFFSHFARAYGDIADEANFGRFAADFATSDYYILTGLEADWLLRRRPRSYAEAFRAVMDEMARRQDGDVWIEKSPQHTLLGEELAAAFPDARFVAILRRAHAVVNSHLWLGGEPPLYIGRPPRYPARLVRLAKLSAVYALHDRWLRRFCRPRARCLLVTYESLAADPTGETARVCEFLGIPFESSMLDLPWRKNTSVKSPGMKSLGAADRIVVTLAVNAFRVVPLQLLNSLIRRRQSRGQLEWPVWCWRRRDAKLVEPSASSNR